MLTIRFSRQSLVVLFIALTLLIVVVAAAPSTSITTYQDVSVLPIKNMTELAHFPERRFGNGGLIIVGITLITSTLLMSAFWGIPIAITAISGVASQEFASAAMLITGLLGSASLTGGFVGCFQGTCNFHNNNFGLLDQSKMGSIDPVPNNTLAFNNYMDSTQFHPNSSNVKILAAALPVEAKNVSSSSSSFILASNDYTTNDNTTYSIKSYFDNNYQLVFASITQNKLHPVKYKNNRRYDANQDIAFHFKVTDSSRQCNVDLEQIFRDLAKSIADEMLNNIQSISCIGAIYNNCVPLVMGGYAYFNSKGDPMIPINCPTDKTKYSEVGAEQANGSPGNPGGQCWKGRFNICE